MIQKKHQFVFLYFLVFTFLVSCGGTSEKWICTDKEFSQNSVTIEGNSVKTHLLTINSDGNEFYDDRSFTIDETIYHERDKNQRIHIVYNKEKNYYSILPELIVDPHTRKYLPYEANIDICHSKEELKGHLYEKIQVRNAEHPENGPISGPQFYAFFGHLKLRGPIFKKE